MSYVICAKNQNQSKHNEKRLPMIVAYCLTIGCTRTLPPWCDFCIKANDQDSASSAGEPHR
ncbi:MAG: hypothetical protein ACYTEE_06420 [Planctomycetota bacterium]